MKQQWDFNTTELRNLYLRQISNEAPGEKLTMAWEKYLTNKKKKLKFRKEEKDNGEKCKWEVELVNGGEPHDNKAQNQEVNDGAIKKEANLGKMEATKEERHPQGNKESNYQKQRFFFSLETQRYEMQQKDIQKF